MVRGGMLYDILKSVNFESIHAHRTHVAYDKGKTHERDQVVVAVEAIIVTAVSYPGNNTRAKGW
jgi:hypothetical protein